MGLGRLLTRQASTPAQTRSAGANFQVVIDGNPINYPSSIYRGAMTIPGAWRAALLISDLLGGVPWDAYRSRGGNPIEQLDPTPLLLEQPAPPDTRMTTMSSLALDLVWHGNAVGVIAARNRDGWPTALVPVPAEQVGVRRVPDNAVAPLPPGTVEYQVGGLSFAPWEVLHIKGPCAPGALRGFGVLEAHLDGTLNLAMEQAKQAASISRHGVPTGVLKVSNPDATEGDLREAKEGWLRSQRDRTVAALNSTTEFEPLSWNPEELQLVEARKFSLHELALIFGLPLSFLGADQASRTYSNIEQEAINLLKFTLGGHLARFEQTFSQHMPRGTTAKANLDAILRADTLSRYRAHQIGLTAGFLTRDEVRELEDRPPLTDEQKAELDRRALPNRDPKPHPDEVPEVEPA
ncbi:HK97 family phage portal protein [Prauserella shujinwangii]|uniref:HK97 family phage portal protein n=1 Tax=Prauserella shujinwangii TaxID=1453103 RepID=A0A2T0LXC7_9PSEU|nr:phage portal protein [Prauserella shujinwangii]PRX48676.1 HK97 family phage portal protein [Prauserella shujinwangii]